MWNYAELAHVAKLAGGPEMLIEAIARKGFQAGVNSMNVPLIIVGSGAFLLGCGVTAFISKHNQKVKQIELEGRMAERILVEQLTGEVQNDDT